jgi:hypothetical protein
VRVRPQRAKRRAWPRGQRARVDARVAASQDETSETSLCVSERLSGPVGNSRAKSRVAARSGITSGAFQGDNSNTTHEETPPLSSAASHRESSPIAMLPDVATSAVLPLQELPEPDTSDSDEGELQVDESVAREWRRLLDYGCSTTPRLLLILPD